MDPIPVEELTLEEFADVLADVLVSKGYGVDKTRSIALKVGDDVMDWSYPSIVLAVKAGRSYLFVPRFGVVAEVPGYLAKYLHATRQNAPDFQLSIACRDAARDGYGALCRLYGLGLVTCSFASHKLVHVNEPVSDVDISQAYDREVDLLLSRIETVFAARLLENDRNAARFKKEAERSHLADRAIEFDAESRRIAAERNDLVERCADARAAKNMQDLRELQKAVEELG